MGPLRSTGRSKARHVGHPLAFAEDFGLKASVFPLGDFFVTKYVFQNQILFTKQTNLQKINITTKTIQFFYASMF